MNIDVEVLRVLSDVLDQVPIGSFENIINPKTGYTVDIEFVEAIKQHNPPLGESRQILASDSRYAYDGGTSQMHAQEVVALEGIVARCRHGHELRVGYDRLEKLQVSADGYVYVQGN